MVVVEPTCFSTINYNNKRCEQIVSFDARITVFFFIRHRFRQLKLSPNTIFFAFGVIVTVSISLSLSLLGEKEMEKDIYVK